MPAVKTVSKGVYRIVVNLLRHKVYPTRKTECMLKRLNLQVYLPTERK